jgi:hypothetical protein
MDASPAASGRIFMSYRREETSYAAGWLYDRLADHFRDGQIFKDVDSIQLGDDFVETISRAVQSCDVLLALIGDRWLTVTDDTGRRRLDDPDDFVRLEIEAALARNVRVIPVLVDGARMPRAEELPAGLAKLARRQALELSPSSFEHDTNRLLGVLGRTVAEVHSESRPAPAAPPQGAPPPPIPAPAPAAPPAPPPASAPAAPSVTAASPPQRGRSSQTWMLVGIGAGVALIALAVIVMVVSRSNGSACVDLDSAEVTSPEELTLTDLNVECPADTLEVGDEIVVSFSLTNDSDDELVFEGTFVGVRDAADQNLDSDNGNAGLVLEPGEGVEVRQSIELGSSGTWLVWPCYTLQSGALCPDEWQAFEVVVE